jgi:hypothetical protein
MSTRLIVRQVTRGEGTKLIADVPDYDGPVPVAGQYIFHPPLNPRASGLDSWDGGIAGCVRQVSLAIYGRPQNGENHFTGRNTNVIVVTI